MATPVSTAPGRGAPPRATTKRRREGWAALGFLTPSMGGLLLFTLVPMVGSLVISFFAWPVLGERTFTGLDNFRQLFVEDPIFRQVMLNTVVFVLAYVPLNLAVSMGLAVWMSPRIKARGLYRLLFFIPTVTPMVANALVWRLLLQPGGVFDNAAQSVGLQAPNFLGDTRWAMASLILMSVWQGFGYNMLVFSAGLDAIPETILEAAAIDGAGPWRRFWSVTLPMMSPAIFFAMVMTLITSFQVFVQPYILTNGGPGVTTTTMVLYLYRTGFQFFNLGLASAVAWMLFVIIMLVTALQFVGQKRWVNYDS
ncbi:MAG TPA: sugar ABC transporter permease [Nocardioidaceae bacterium]|nr:sugar ABC transporter permease [Nocardioidaceae bacterium]